MASQFSNVKKWIVVELPGTTTNDLYEQAAEFKDIVSGFALSNDALASLFEEMVLERKKEKSAELLNELQVFHQYGAYRGMILSPRTVLQSVDATKPQNYMLERVREVIGKRNRILVQNLFRATDPLYVLNVIESSLEEMLKVA